MYMNCDWLVGLFHLFCVYVCCCLCLSGFKRKARRGSDRPFSISSCKSFRCIRRSSHDLWNLELRHHQKFAVIFIVWCLCCCVLFSIFDCKSTTFFVICKHSGEFFSKIFQILVLSSPQRLPRLSSDCSRYAADITHARQSRNKLHSALAYP